MDKILNYNDILLIGSAGVNYYGGKILYEECAAGYAEKYKIPQSNIIGECILNSEDFKIIFFGKEQIAVSFGESGSLNFSVLRRNSYLKCMSFIERIKENGYDIKILQFQ